MLELCNELVRKAITTREHTGVWKNATLGPVSVFSRCNEEDHTELHLCDVSFIVSWGGMRLGPLGTQSTVWLIVSAPDDG
jgi:hypothetical protein